MNGRTICAFLSLVVVSGCDASSSPEYVGTDDVRGHRLRIFSESGVLKHFMALANQTDKGDFIELVLARKATGISIYPSLGSRIINCPLEKKGTYSSYQMFHKQPDGKIEGALLVLSWGRGTACVEAIPQTDIPV